MSATDTPRLLVEASGLLDYVDHGSWRCAHPPHFYLADGPPDEPDYCPCGLLRALRAAGVDPEPWRPAA